MTKFLLAASIAALASTAALADHSFIMPSFSNLNGSQSIVQIDAAGADNVFQFDHRPVQLESIKIYKPDGSEAPKPEGAMQTRFRSTFDLKLDAPGTWKIATSNVMVGGTAMVDGVERRVTNMRMGPRPGGMPGMGGPGGPGGGEGRRPEGGPPGGPNAGPPRMPPIQLAELPANATDVKLAEMVSRTEAFVTVGAPTTQVFGDTKGLSLQPITHPTDLVSNEPARFKLLIDGAPAAKIKVALIPGGQRFRDGEAAIELTTDAQGVVTIKWPAPGYYLLTAEAEDSKVSEKRAQVRKLSYAATLEVAAP